jgi:hypothetical protein
MRFLALISMIIFEKSDMVNHGIEEFRYYLTTSLF